jgi:molybdopterin/thiamine biosynthesis adenylyltransferase
MPGWPFPAWAGSGGVHLITLARTGIGKFHIADFDTFEPANVNRQFGATVPDFGREKLTVMKEQALAVNPFLDLTLFEEGIHDDNMDAFLDGVDVVVDGLDFFNFDIRRLLFNTAREKGIYVVTAAPLGFSSALLVFAPDKGMRFDEYFDITIGMKPEDQYLAFAMGLAPRPTHIKYMDLKKVDLDSKAGPSLNIACQISSGMAAAEAVKIILNKGKIKPVPHYVQYDPYLQKLRKSRLFMGNKNPWQKVKLQAIKILLEKNKNVIKPDIPEKPVFDLIPGDDIPETVIDYLIKAGIQAPSGDNCQPWKFDCKKNKIDLYLDREKDQSFFNVNQIASLIACGAALENIKIAASSFGIKAKIEYAANNNDKDLIAAVKLVGNKVKKDDLSDFIWERHTNRKFYKKTSVSPEILQEIESSIKNIPGAKLHFVTDREDLKRLGKIVYQVDRIRTEHRPLHEHLMKMIRFSDQQAMEKRDGFPLKNLEAGLAGELFLKATKPWPVMDIANKIGLGRMVALHSYQGTVNSSGAALLTIDGTDGLAFIEGGRAIEQVWLTVSSLGLAMQPMTAITLFYLRRMLEGKSNFLEKHQKVLERVYGNYKQIFPVIGDENYRQIMLFRFGYAENIRIRTLRR